MLTAKPVEQFLDDRFGLFIHWGVYSRLAGEWQGRRVGGELGEWIMNLLQIPIVKYEQEAAEFLPHEFDAEALVQLAKQAGMRYIVITTKHHDGFAMFRSYCDPYNIYDWGGFGRDILAELAAACRRHGMKLGFYYSQALDWHEEHAGGWDVQAYGMRPSWANVWDYPDNQKKDFARYFERKVKPQVTELLTQYGDVYLMWFDTPRTISSEQSEELYQLVKHHQPECLVNSRIGNGRGDYESLGDNQIPTVTLHRAHEAPVTLNDTWGYKHYDHNWKTADEIITMLVKLTARNVNMLLNVGPMGNGCLPEPTLTVLRRVGDWMADHSEAIHNTRPYPVATAFDWGSVTVGSERMCLCFERSQEQEITFYGLTTPIEEAVLLGQENSRLHYEAAGAELKLPPLQSSSGHPVVSVRCRGPVRFQAELQQQNRSLVLLPTAAEIYDEKLRPAEQIKVEQRYGDDRHLPDMRIELGGSLSGWCRADQWLEWSARFHRTGCYDVQWITEASLSDEVRREAVLTLWFDDEQVLAGGLNVDDAYTESRTGKKNQRIVTRAGSLTILKPGIYRIRIQLEQDLTAGSLGLVAVSFVQRWVNKKECVD